MSPSFFLASTSCPLEVTQLFTDLEMNFKKNIFHIQQRAKFFTKKKKKISLGKKFQKNLLADSESLIQLSNVTQSWDTIRFPFTGPVLQVDASEL